MSEIEKRSQQVRGKKHSRSRLLEHSLRNFVKQRDQKLNGDRYDSLKTIINPGNLSCKSDFFIIRTKLIARLPTNFQSHQPKLRVLFQDRSSESPPQGTFSLSIIDRKLWIAGRGDKQKKKTKVTMLAFLQEKKWATLVDNHRTLYYSLLQASSNATF